AAVRQVRALRRAEAIPDGRPDRTRRHARAANHLSRGTGRCPAVHWSAVGRVHRCEVVGWKRPMSPGRILLTLVLAPVASACTIGPRYAPPAIKVPIGWQESVPATESIDRASLATWWTAFNDPVLDGLVARASAGNLDVKIAMTRVREARAARGISESAAWPQVDAYGRYARVERSDAVPPFNAVSGVSPFGARTQNVFDAGFDAYWELDVFG